MKLIEGEWDSSHVDLVPMRDMTEKKKGFYPAYNRFLYLLTILLEGLLSLQNGECRLEMAGMEGLEDLAQRLNGSLAQFTVSSSRTGILM